MASMIDLRILINFILRISGCFRWSFDQLFIKDNNALNFESGGNQNIFEMLKMRSRVRSYTLLGGMKHEHQRRRQDISKKLSSCLLASQLLALHAARDDASSAIAIAILYISWIGHMDFLRLVAYQLDGATSSIIDLTAIAAFSQKWVNGLNLIPA